MIRSTSLVPLSQLEFLGPSYNSHNQSVTWLVLGDDMENSWQRLYECLLFCPIIKYLRRLHFCISFTSLPPPSEEILLGASPPSEVRVAIKAF